MLSFISLLYIFSFVRGSKSIPSKREIFLKDREQSPEMKDFISDDFINKMQRVLQNSNYTPNVYACGEIIEKLSPSQVKEAMVSFYESIPLVGLFDFNGIQIQKICASCSDFPSPSVDDDNYGEYRSFCGPDVHGFNETISGLLIIPLIEEETTGNLVIEPNKTMIGNVYCRISDTASDWVPSSRWERGVGNGGPNASEILIPATAAGSGMISILPDYLGFGESARTLYKAFGIKRAYQTATIPLWLEAERTLRNMTNCSTALADAAITFGASEGGYASVAVADALSKGLGIEIVGVEAFTGPYKVSLNFRTFFQNIALNPSEDRYFYILPSVGSSYSSSYPNVANFGSGQDLLSAESRSDLIELMFEGGRTPVINQYLRKRFGDDVLQMFDPNITSWLLGHFESNQTQDGLCEGSDVLPGFNDKLCEAFAENDLTNILESAQYPVFLCHSPDDKVSDFSNLPDIEKNPEFLTYIPAEDTHFISSGFCLISRVLNLRSDRNYVGYAIKPKHGDSCESGAPSSAPSLDNETSSAPNAYLPIYMVPIILLFSWLQFIN